MKPVIEVSQLSKRYLIAHRTKNGYRTFRDEIVGVLGRPLHLFDRSDERTDDFWALRDINFTVEPGEVIGIIGNNGSGKSTLVKILSRITDPTEGQAVIRGKLASLLEVGTGFHPELSGRENIFLNGAILGMTRSEVLSKFDQIVEFASIETFLDTPVKHYSSGMYVRLAFSVAAHLEPDILIVDEVLSVGDAEFQRKSLGKMDDVTKKAGRTIIFVSHNMDAIQRICTKCILLKDGKIVLFGRTDKVIARYLKPDDQELGVPLRQRPDRRGLGNVIFTSVAITNTQGSSAIYSGDRLRLALRYENRLGNRVPFARILISVVNESLRPVVRFDSDVTSDSFTGDLDPQGIIMCETDELHLVEGRYFVNVNFWNNDVQASEDEVDLAADFNVIANMDRYRYRLPSDRSISDLLMKYVFSQVAET